MKRERVKKSKREKKGVNASKKGDLIKKLEKRRKK